MTDVPANRVQRALEVLLERAGEASRVMSGGAGGLTLAEAGEALESVADTADLLWQLLGPLADRVEEIREREVTERREGSSMDLMERASVHVLHGRDGLSIALHLLWQGRGDLLRVERGECQADEGSRGEGEHGA